MEREFLFRVWCKDSKQYLKGDFSIGIESGEFRSKYGEVYKNVIIEQFTGLTDKNGVKIFEGDILKHRYKDDVKGVVSFYEGAFVVGIAVTFNALINFNAPKNLEVIGNIHD